LIDVTKSKHNFGIFCQFNYTSDKSTATIDRCKLHLSTVGENKVEERLIRTLIGLLGLQIGLGRECGGEIWIIKNHF